MKGNKIRALRKERKLTQIELGNMIGVSETTIRNAETGNKKTSDKVLNSLANVFKIDVEELKNDEDYLIALEILEYINILIERHDIKSVENITAEIELEILKFIKEIIKRKLQ